MPRKPASKTSFAEVRARRQESAQIGDIGFCAYDHHKPRLRCRLIGKVGVLDVVEWLDPPYSDYNPSAIHGFATHQTKREPNRADAVPTFHSGFEIAVEAFVLKSGACDSASQLEKRLVVGGTPLVVPMPNEPFWGMLVRRSTRWLVEPLSYQQAFQVTRRLIDCGATCPQCNGAEGKVCDLCKGKGFVIPATEAEAKALTPHGVRWGSVAHATHEQARKYALSQGYVSLGIGNETQVLENLARLG